MILSPKKDKEKDNKAIIKQNSSSKYSLLRNKLKTEKKRRKKQRTQRRTRSLRNLIKFKMHKKIMINLDDNSQLFNKNLPTFY